MVCIQYGVQVCVCIGVCGAHIWCSVSIGTYVCGGCACVGYMCSVPHPKHNS